MPCFRHINFLIVTMWCEILILLSNPMFPGIVVIFLDIRVFSPFVVWTCEYDEITIIVFYLSIIYNDVKSSSCLVKMILVQPHFLRIVEVIMSVLYKRTFEFFIFCICVKLFASLLSYSKLIAAILLPPRGRKFSSGGPKVFCWSAYSLSKVYFLSFRKDKVKFNSKLVSILSSSYNHTVLTWYGLVKHGIEMECLADDLISSQHKSSTERYSWSPPVQLALFSWVFLLT